MKRWPLVLGVVLGVASLGIGVAVGHDVAERWLLASRYTARVGFPLLLVVFCGAAVAQLSRGAAQGLVRDRRWWLLGFAATQVVHLYALIRYAPFATMATPPDGYAVYAVLLVLALTANDGAERAMGRAWGWVHEVGIDIMWLVYTAVYVFKSTVPAMRASVLPLAAVSIAALGVRVVAWVVRRRERSTDVAT